MYKENLSWYVIDKEYINYLKKYDNKVQDIEYGKDLKPYIGIVFQFNNFDYYVPISSFKNKHYKMNPPDMYKIIKNDKGLGVLNLNNMIPIMPQQATLLKYAEIEKYKTFKNSNEKINYIRLLDSELRLINNEINKIVDRAKKIYFTKTNYPESKTSMRCCNFKLLEEKCLKYNESEGI